MASEKTLALRAASVDERGPDGPRRLTQGPTFTEGIGHGKLLSSNRHGRLTADATGLSRAQRRELARLRKLRKFEQYDPPPPDWAVPKPDTIMPQAQVDGIVADVKRLFDHNQVDLNGYDYPPDCADRAAFMFGDWKARCVGHNLTRRQLDAAVGLITARLKPPPETLAPSGEP